MDIGKVNAHDPNSITYYSEVLDVTPDTVIRFHDRVRGWATRSGIQLGEGTMVPFTSVGSDEKKVLLLIAPVIDGDITAIDSNRTYPDDETCFNLGPKNLGDQAD